MHELHCLKGLSLPTPPPPRLAGRWGWEDRVIVLAAPHLLAYGGSTGLTPLSHWAGIMQLFRWLGGQGFISPAPLHDCVSPTHN